MGSLLGTVGVMGASLGWFRLASRSSAKGNSSSSEVSKTDIERERIRASSRERGGSVRREQDRDQSVGGSKMISKAGLR